jgi:DNA invertase Pin-like site-specific DNA recombinase
MRGSSTADQASALQLDELRVAGCEHIWTDHATGTRADRPQLGRLLEHMREGDTLVVWRLDRLARSLSDLLALAARLELAGVGLRSLREHIDTTTPGGRLIFQVFGALAEFEGALVRERTHAGLAAARARGRRGGRKPVMTPAKIATARRMRAHRRADCPSAGGQSRHRLPRSPRHAEAALLSQTPGGKGSAPNPDRSSVRPDASRPDRRPGRRRRSAGGRRLHAHANAAPDA